jgi:hypothetical protein
LCAAAAHCDDDALPPPRAPVATVSGGNALHDEAARELAAVKSTTYSHRVRVDEAAGVFEYDCSGFVDYAIGNTTPDAFRQLGRRRPAARTYVDLLTAIPRGQSRGRWLHVDQPSALREGDVVAWLAVSSKPDAWGIVNTGHVMIVDGPPRERSPGEWVVPIVDSSFGHGGTDPRAKRSATGLGRGTMVVVVENGSLVGYHWSESARSPLIRTTVVMGRIL